MRRLACAALAAILVAASCSSASDDNEAADTITDEPGRPAATEGSCDPTDESHCLLPFPGPRLSVADPATDTGMRLSLPDGELPTNAEGTSVDPTDLNQADGFSSGTPILVHLPKADLEASGAPMIGTIERSLEDDSTIVLIDADTGERHPAWAEQDGRAAGDDGRLLIIRPAQSLHEGHRYLVAIRGLVDSAGAPIEPSPAFGAYRDGSSTQDDDVEEWRAHWEDVFADLGEAGIGRDDLIAAWDFQVASAADRSGRLLAMRDRAFADLGDAPPIYEVLDVKGDVGSTRIVRGTYEVPKFLTASGEPGSRLSLGEDGLPVADGIFVADFVCAVPPDTTTAQTVLYGHGLLGSLDEGEDLGGLLAPVVGAAVCATNWVGMSTEDVANVVESLGDLSTFGSIPDRLQQAHLNFLFLGRLAAHEQGFAASEAFQNADGTPAISGEVAFLGNSQGGILGGATSAVAQDWEHVVLGVPAMNYSTLLRRSIDFDEFLPVFTEAYPDEAEQTLALALVQQLWDRGENQGYAAHLTADPYPDTPAKQVLLFEAFGDHQVANVATESLARTIGASVRAPILDEGRTDLASPFFGLGEVDLPADGAAFLVVWDFGTPAPPQTNIPPREGDDPHGKGSSVLAVIAMAAGFLDTGTLVEPCDGAPCQTLPD